MFEKPRSRRAEFYFNGNCLVRAICTGRFERVPSFLRHLGARWLNDCARRLLKNPRMPRCCQFSEGRKELSAGLMGCGVPISPQSRGATDQLGDIVRAENRRNLGGKKGSQPFLGVSSLGILEG
jgi:hypothetical protein